MSFVDAAQIACHLLSSLENVILGPSRRARGPSVVLPYVTELTRDAHLTNRHAHVMMSNMLAVDGRLPRALLLPPGRRPSHAPVAGLLSRTD